MRTQVPSVSNCRPAVSLLLVAAAILAVSCPSAPPDNQGRETLRLLVDTGGETDTAVVERKIAAAIGRPVSVRRLFDNVDRNSDPELLAEMFQVVVPGGKAPAENKWDIAYGLQDAIGFEKVEPDESRTLEPSVVERGSTCFIGDTVEAPSNRLWSLETMKVSEAWALTPAPGGRRQGEGIRVCHPDTGWSEHVDLDRSRLDLVNARNLLEDGTPDARDPLDYDGFLTNPGHGTATGSAIISGEGAGRISGVAPAATLVPIRTAKSVIQVFDSDLARAIKYSVDAECDVVSMSLGGRAFFGLNAAIRHAKRRNVIVLAAAGNCVGVVVAPAAYPDCIAVGGTNHENLPWKGSSRGRKLAISAPAQHVWVARRENPSDSLDGVKPGEGTSFAVAGTAGVAALWLAYHDLDRHNPYSAMPLQDVFLRLLRETATVPPGWDALRSKFGAGIVNAVALLSHPLPDPGEALIVRGGVPDREQLDLISNILDRDVSVLEPQLARIMGCRIEELDAFLKRFGAELIELALSDPEGFARSLEPGARERGPGVVWASRASRRLRAAMR